MVKNKKKTWEELVADFKSGKLKELKSRIPVYQKSGVDYILIKENPECIIHDKIDWSCSAKKIKRFDEASKKFTESWKIEHNFRIPSISENGYLPN